MATQRARGAALLRVALVLSFLAASDARSSGPASCDARSGHGASDSGGGGYTLAVSNASVDVTAVAPNTRLELLLVAPDGSAFKGFVMHAANAGAFAVADALVSERVESCHAGNAVGHRSASSKTRVRAYFTAPATGGAVTITAQAVESRMVVYETALELTVVEDGDADDAEDEAEDDARVDDRDAAPLATSASSGAGTAARGSGVWFVAHVVAQTGGGALAIAALAVALRESTGETGTAFDWDRADANVALMAHGAFGVALVACVVAQASLGARREKMGRPAEDDDDGAPPPTATQRLIAPAPLRGAHVALGWLLAFGGFANAAVGAGLFERLDARDREAAGASGDASSVFSAVAWTGFAVVAVSFCLRLRRTSRRDAARASGASRAG